MPGSCPPSPGLAPWATLISISRQLFRYSAVDAEPSRGDLLDRRGGVVAVGARLVARRILAALAAVGFGADPVHGDRQGLVRFRRQRAEADARCDQPLADLGDAFDFVDRNRRAAVGAEVEQVARRDQRQLAHRLGVAAIERETVGGDGGLQQVDQPRVEPVRFAAEPAQLVDAADRQGDHILVPGRAHADRAPCARCRAGRCPRCVRSCRGRIPPPARATGRSPRNYSRRDRRR